MFNITTAVNQGILFLRLKGNLDDKAFSNFSEEINYLLYNQGINYFVINFKELDNVDKNIFSKIQTKLVEIFLTCGKVALCGLNKEIVNYLGLNNENLFYVKNEVEAFKYLEI